MTQYKASPRVEITQVEADLFLVDPEAENIYHLGPVGAGLWRLLAEPQNEESLFSVLQSAFPDIPETRLREDIDRIIGEMKTRDLLDILG